MFWLLLGDLFLPILSLAPDPFSSFAPPETLMDTKWVTSELAWTSHPESGVRRPSSPSLLSVGCPLYLQHPSSWPYQGWRTGRTLPAAPPPPLSACHLPSLPHGPSLISQPACVPLSHTRPLSHSLPTPQPVFSLSPPLSSLTALCLSALTLSFLPGSLGRALAWEPGNLGSRFQTCSVTLSKAVYLSGPPFLDY